MMTHQQDDSNQEEKKEGMTMSIQENSDSNSSNQDKDKEGMTMSIPEAQDNAQGTLTEINGGKDIINDTDTINVKDTVTDKGKKTEKTDEEKAQEKIEKENNRWKQQLDTANAVIKAIQTESGVAWTPTNGMTHFSIDVGEKAALRNVRLMNGGLPISERRGKDIMLKLEKIEDDRIAEGEIKASQRVPRFWTDGAKNDLKSPSYIYRGGLDYKVNPPLYKIDEDGVHAMNNSGESGAVFTHSGGMETIPAGLEQGDIRDIEYLWKFMNLSPEYRTLALGAVLAPAVNSHMERPVIFTTGPSETGKTTITERLASLVDPKPGGETSTRTNQGGAVIEQAALNTDTLIIGNISSISLAASNALCQIGGGSTRKERELYANGSNVEYVIRSTAMISTKEEHIRLEDDLQTRIIPLPTSPFTQEQIAAFPTAEEWEEALPRLQAAALAIISAIKKDAKDNPDIKFSNPYRWKGVGEVIERTERVLKQSGIKVNTPWTESLRSAKGILSHRSTPAWVDFIIDDLTESVAGSPGAVLKKMKEIAGSSSNEWYVSQQNFRRELEQHQEVLREEGVGVDIVKKVGGSNPRYEVIITPTAANNIDDYVGGNVLEKR